MKIEKIWDFCQFRCQFETFFIAKIEIISFLKTTGQGVATLLTFLNTPIQEKWKHLGFCHFLCQFEIFSHSKTAIISSEKTTVQRIRAILIVFIILFHEVYRKFDKN